MKRLIDLVEEANQFLMAPKAIWWVIVLFVCFNCKCNKASDSNLSREEELELERELKLLNKPSIKTYQTKEGDIIDCVDINKQPALDHPLLKNHKVQARPSRSLFDGLEDSSQSKHDPLISSNDREPCPHGFVPIRRTLMKYLIRSRSLSSMSNKQTNEYIRNVTMGGVTFPYDQNVVSLSTKRTIKYYGVDTYAAVYSLNVANDQSSSTNIWIVGGPVNALNVILAGWQVNPAVNGDSRTRLFVYWTSDGGATTGCYNLLCQGFVQLDPMITPDFPLYPTSTYQGQQYDYQFSVHQDPQSRNWFLQVSEKANKTIGYWPNELFPRLTNGADQVAWGGIARPSPTGVSPPLGNGHMPNGKIDEASYFRNIKFITDGLQKISPDWRNTVKYVSRCSCYNLDRNDMECGRSDMFYCFTFGGPGGNICRAGE